MREHSRAGGPDRSGGASDAPDAEAEVCLPATLDAFGDESAETPFE